MPPARRPTMRDVAAAAGVSLKTVSRAVNGEPMVRPETAARVLAAAEALGFRPNDMARDLRSGRNASTIAVVVDDVGGRLGAAIVRAAEEEAHRHGVLVVAVSSGGDPARERELVGMLSGRRVNGLLVAAAPSDQRHLRTEVASGTPVVLLDRPAGGSTADAVLVDHAGGAASAATHLLDRGRRHVAMLGGRGDADATPARVEGLGSALRAAGARVDERLLGADLDDPSDAAAAIARLLDDPIPPTAIVALDEGATAAAVHELWPRGADVDVVTFGDHPRYGLAPIRLTVVTWDAAELGRVGAELLFARLDGTAGRRPRQVVLPTRLVERGLPSRGASVSDRGSRRGGRSDRPGGSTGRR